MFRFCTIHGDGSTVHLGLLRGVVLLAVLLSFPSRALAQAPIQIAGDERLAWDQERLDPAVPPGAYDFALYADGGRYVLANVTCTADAGSVMLCSASLPEFSPGHHILQITASVGGRESELSGPIAIVASPRLPVVGTASDQRLVPALTSGVPTGGCAGSHCYVAQALFASNRTISQVVAADEHTLFFVDDSRYVRVVSHGEVVPEPALVLDNPAQRIIALGADARFSDTRVVFAAWLDDSVPDAPTLSVGRFREINSRFGQRAVVVADLPVPVSDDPSVVWDASGQIFIAIPQPLAGERPHPYGGKLLRLASDGTVARTSGQTSPVFSDGMESPVSMALDPATGRLWLAGQAESSSRLVVVSAAVGGGAQQTALGNLELTSIAPSTDPATPLFAVNSDGVVLVTARGAVAGSFEPVLSFEDSVATEVSTASGGVYVVLRSDDGPLPIYSLLRVIKP